MNGNKVSFEAYIEQIRPCDTRYNCPRVLIKNVFIDGVFVRDHMWIKLKSKQLSKIKRAHMLKATGRITYYLNPVTLKKDKIGLEKIANIEIFKEKK